MLNLINKGNIINQDIASTMNSLYERCLGVLEELYEYSLPYR